MHAWCNNSSTFLLQTDVPAFRFMGFVFFCSEHLTADSFTSFVSHAFRPPVIAFSHSHLRFGEMETFSRIRYVRSQAVMYFHVSQRVITELVEKVCHLI